MGQQKEIQCTVFAAVCVTISALTLARTVLAGAGIEIILLVTTSVGFAVLAALCWEIVRHQPANSHRLTTLFTQYVFMKMIRLKGKKCHAEILAATEDLPRVQENLVRNIIQHNKDTEYGKKYDFTHITCRDDLRRKCPLTTYDDYADSVNKIANGEQNILTEDPVIFFAVSSGTTGKNKMIPVTKSLAKHGKSVGLTLYYMTDRKCGLDLQRPAVLRYKPRVSQTTSGITIAPVTYHLSKYFPFYVAPRCVYDISNENAALYCHAVFMLSEREVGFIDGLMSTLVYSFWVVVEKRWKEICEDIELGHIRPESGVETDLLCGINKNMKANPSRAQVLREEFEKGMRGISKRVWPNCRYVRMLNTAAFAHYATMLRESYMEGVYQLSLVHGSSEGFVGVNIDPDPSATSYLALPTSCVLEFIPEQLCQQEQPDTCFLEQLREGEYYEIVLTTAMGLYRYRTGDVIKVQRHLNQCPVYVFQYRSGQLLNIYWEKTNEETLYRSVLNAVKSLGLSLVDYTTTEDSYLLGTDFENIRITDKATKRYVLFIEAVKDGNPYNMTKTEKAEFDKCLCAQSELYGTLREQGSIGEMLVLQAQAGIFQNLRTQLVGKHQNQQVKTPRVLHDKRLLELLL